MITARPKPLTIAGLLAAVLSILGLLATASSAEASTYTIYECHPSQGSVNDLQLEGPAPGYVMQNGCGGSNTLQAGASAAVSPGGYRQYVIQAPNGTRMNNVSGSYGIQGTTNPEGHKAYMFVRKVGQGEQTVAESNGAGGFSANFDLVASGQGLTPIDRIGIGMICQRSAQQGNCPQKSGIYSRLGDLQFSMQDTVAPSTPTTSSTLVSGSWKTGNTALIIDAHDTGAGVSATSTWVNDQLVDFAFTCSASGTSLKPCPANAQDGGSFNVGSSPFGQGDNALRTCVGEYGDNPAVTCKTETVKVDTIAPTAPTSPAVTGGEGWKRDRDNFDLSWSNPGQGANTAPIVGASVRITGPGGYENTAYFAGAGRTSIDDLSVPNVVGDYTATVYLRDAAGNETVANGAQVHLRFDDTVPAQSLPEKANGWISRAELAGGYLQRWDPPAPADVPPSGIAGYRAIVNTNSDTDPCAGAVPDPRACSGPITEAGQSNTSRILGPGALPDGVNYVHVAPVSGSGMRATAVGHEPLKVDTSDPTVSLAGDASDGWINRDVVVRSISVDPLSGMVDTDEFPNDAPPATFLTVDGAQVSDGDADVSATVSAEGIHKVSYWGRDLAGNTAEPRTSSIRVDKTAPLAGFTNRQDPTDPDRLVVPVSDQLSGVVDGSIAYRQADGSEWKTLETRIDGEQLVARVDSADLRESVVYRFRAIATDRAGNTITTTKRQDGSEMSVVGPFRTITTLSNLKVNGKPSATVRYGKGAVVSGAVSTRDGSSVGKTTVELVQKFRSGTKKRTKVITTTTDESGAFKAKVGRGPSRAISARFAGDKIYLGSSSAQSKLGVRGKITLKVPSTAKAGVETTFKGKIKAVGAKFPRAGKRLELQVKVGKKWKSVGKSFRSSKKGAWRLDYRFGDFYEEPTRFQFRAVVLRERSWPYLPAISKKRSVVVSP